MHAAPIAILLFSLLSNYLGKLGVTYLPAFRWVRALDKIFCFLAGESDLGTVGKQEGSVLSKVALLVYKLTVLRHHVLYIQ